MRFALVHAADAGIGNHEVEGRSVVSRQDPAPHGGAIGNVDGGSGDLGAPRAAVGGDSIESSGVAAAEAEAHPGGGIVARQRGADAAGGAGDQDVAGRGHGGNRCWRGRSRL